MGYSRHATDLFADPALTARGVALRAARDDDATFQRMLFETARPDAVILAAWPEAVRKTFLDQQFQFQSIHYARTYPDADRLVVLANGEPAGRLILSRAPGEWCIVDIALLPIWRGKGIGTQLLRQVQAAAVLAQVPKLRLTVDSSNPARRLYQRLGFSVVEEGIPNIEMAWRSPPVS